MAGIGLLRHARGVNEVISSLLATFIIVAVFDFLIEGTLRDPSSTSFPATLPVPEQFRIGKIPGFEANWGLAIGIIGCLLAAIGLGRTNYGFSARIVGGNFRAAQTLGLSVGFHIVFACAMCGVLAGLAGAIEVLAVHGQASGALHRAGYGLTGRAGRIPGRFPAFGRHSGGRADRRSVGGGRAAATTLRRARRIHHGRTGDGLCLDPRR